MASTPIGGLRVDLSLNSAAFIRDIAKTNAVIATNTKQMGQNLTRLKAVAQSVGAGFGAWVTARSVRRVFTFLEQSIELAAKLDNQLGKTAKAFVEQGEAMNNAFKLGVAQGFISALQTGLDASKVSLEDLAKAGILLGNVLGRVFTSIVNFLTVEIPRGVNQSVTQINSAINAYNRLAAAREANAMQPSALAGGAAGSGLIGEAGSSQIPLIPTVDEGTIKSWVDFSGAQGLASSALGLTNSAMDAQTEAMKRAGEEFSRMADLQRDLYDTIRTPMEQYEAQLARISAAQLNAADTAKLQGMAQMELANTWLGAASAVSGSLAALFKENKAVAIANAVINTAEAITAALKNPPGPPFSYVYAAAAAVAGAAQIATIASSQPGTSKAIKKPTGGTSGAAKAGSSSKGSGGGGTQQAVTINVTGESFGPEHFRKLVSGLNAVIADGATLKVQ
jgi:hypothetical protein